MILITDSKGDCDVERPSQLLRDATVNIWPSVIYETFPVSVIFLINIYIFIDINIKLATLSLVLFCFTCDNNGFMMLYQIE